MSDTPRTDEQEFNEAGNYDVAWSDFARILERENNQLREQLEDARNPVHSCSPACKRVACVMRRERDQLREALKECAEALNAINNSPSIIRVMNGETILMLGRALLTPAVQQALKEKE